MNAEVKIDACFEREPWAERLIQIHRDGTWSPSERHGVRAVLLPIFDPRGGEDLIDVVAWRVEEPRKWWLRRGIATHLGQQDLEQCWWEDRPIKLISRPRDWMFDSGPSVCILQWTADLRAILWRAPEVRCADYRMKKYLEARLAAQVRPRFGITVGQ